MRRVTRVLLLVVVITAGVAFWGCNKNLDDPTQAEGILSIEKVEPAVVRADITLTDPNTGQPTPLQDDTTSITIKNRARTTSAGNLADIAVTKTERTCTFAGASFPTVSGPGGFTIPVGSSVSIVITAVTVQEKGLPGAAQGNTWQCFVKIKGEDLAGNPAESDFTSFSVNFVDI